MIMVTRYLLCCWREVIEEVAPLVNLSYWKVIHQIDPSPLIYVCHQSLITFTFSLSFSCFQSNWLRSRRLQQQKFCVKTQITWNTYKRMCTEENRQSTYPSTTNLNYYLIRSRKISIINMIFLDLQLLLFLVYRNPVVSCDSLPDTDLRAWREASGNDNILSSSFPSLSSIILLSVNRQNQSLRQETAR